MKKCPLNRAQIEELTQKFPTPFHLYDEAAIRKNARSLNAAFAWNPGFKEYFAVKATPNPYLMKILNLEGLGADCSSLPELILAEKLGLSGEEIIFTSNDTPANEYIKAAQMGAIINFDDLNHIDFFKQHATLPELGCFRYNPGPLKAGNAIIGHPEEAKYGLTREQLLEGYRILRDKGVTRFGLHTMVASNELHAAYFIETAQILFDLVVELSIKLDIRFDFVNIGGGIGIPYRPEELPINLMEIGEGIRTLYKEKIESTSLAPLDVRMECGRMITGPYGWLISRVLHKKKTYKTFIGLDACMTHLMRPALYGAYHHITVPEKENLPHDSIYDVTGSLCENNDKFAINRALPSINRGDLIVIHDVGAHGHAMGFNYNGKLRSAELLLRENGAIVQIRRAETVADYFSTLDFNGLQAF